MNKEEIKQARDLFEKLPGEGWICGKDYILSDTADINAAQAVLAFMGAQRKIVLKLLDEVADHRKKNETRLQSL